MSQKQHSEINGVSIVVGKDPMVFWDNDHLATQLRFLSHIDPSYFEYQMRVHQERLGSDDDLHAAVALRATYAHALESLFALIGASVQAPHCPAGWLLRYRFTDLSKLIKDISDGEPFKNALGIERGDWVETSTKLSPWELPEGRIGEHRESTAKFWQYLASEFLDEHLQDEYNNLKHGIRQKSGEWYFAIGREDVPGVPAPAERMHTIARSEYGSTFLRPVNIKKYQWQIAQQRVNWEPQDIIKRIPLVVVSIYNVIAFLRITNGAESEDISGFWFLDREHVEDAMANSDHGVLARFSFTPNIAPDHVPELTREQILQKYDNRKGSNGGDEREAL